MVAPSRSSGRCGDPRHQHRRPGDRPPPTARGGAQVAGQDHISGRHYFRFGPEGIEVFPCRCPVARPGEGALLPTGVAGLDHLLDGGVRRSSSLLLSGESGTGKTILGLQFLSEALAEKGLFLYQEAPEQVQQVAASFGWDLAHLEAEG